MRIAMLSTHSSPIAQLGGKEAGGMNVYVRELSRELGRRGIGVDIFTRSQDRAAPTTIALDRGVRVINLHAGPSAPYDKNWVLTYLPEFVSRVRCFADGQDLAYDLIHSHYWLSGEAALALPLLTTRMVLESVVEPITSIAPNETLTRPSSVAL